MTEYAIRGERDEFGVVPWTCPRFGHLVGEERDEADNLPDSYLPVGYLPVRIREAEKDGVPFYGPTRRTMRGKGLRRSLERLTSAAVNVALDRFEQADAAGGQLDAVRTADYAPITAVVFDSVCWDCALEGHDARLRFRR